MRDTYPPSYPAPAAGRLFAAETLGRLTTPDCGWPPDDTGAT